MFRFVLTLALFGFCPGVAFAQNEALQDEAVASNPSLDALRAKERALRARAEVAGAWSDPMLAIEYSNAPVTSFSLSRHPMSGLQLRAQQTLRPPGWSRLQQESGDARADAMGFAVEEAETRLRASVGVTLWMLARTRLLSAVTVEHITRTEELLGAVEARYTTGAVGQHAVLRLQVLLDRLNDELGDFARSERELAAALDEALGRENAGSYEVSDTVSALAPPADADWLGIAEQQRPMLMQIASQRRAAEQSADFARADAIPDVTVWLGYRVRSVQTATDPGTDFVSVGIGAPIPIGSSRRASGARAAWLEEASSSSAALDSARDGITADMASLLAAWERAWTKANTYRDTLIPGAEAALESTRGDFAVGRAQFASLFESEVALLNLERGRIVAAVDTHIHEIRATAVLGTAPSPGAE